MNTSNNEHNKELVRRFIAGLNEGNLDVFDELLAPDFVDHTPLPGVSPTREGWKSAFPTERAAFPDLHFHIEDEIAEGDRVVVRSKGTGTHQGKFMSISATGKEIAVDNVTIFRIAGGKISARWTVFDALGLMVQVGALPSMA